MVGQFSHDSIGLKTRVTSPVQPAVKALHLADVLYVALLWVRNYEMDVLKF